MLERFLEQHPAYAATAPLDALRARDFGRLDAEGQVYLDFTGAALYAASHVREHIELLERQVFGNPHSVNPTSTTTTHVVESARAAALNWFNGAGDYTAVFTPNASGALKLVGKSYRFRPGGRYLMTADNHNSVNGIPRVRGRQGRRRRLCAFDDSRVACRRAETDRAPRQGRPFASQPVRLSGAVEFFRREASAVADRSRPGARLACPARRRRLRPDESARPSGRETRFRRRLVLQDVRLSDRRRLSSDPAIRRSRRSSVRGSPEAR